MFLKNIFVVFLSVGVGADLGGEEPSETVGRVLDDFLTSVELVENTEGSADDVDGTV